MFIERPSSFPTHPFLGCLRAVAIGPAIAGSSAGLAASFQRKTQGRTRRGDDVLDNNAVKPALDAEEFYAMANAHSENGSTQRREY
jgi:hypothetical protein